MYVDLQHLHFSVLIPDFSLYMRACTGSVRFADSTGGGGSAYDRTSQSAPAGNQVRSGLTRTHRMLLCRAFERLGFDASFF